MALNKVSWKALWKVVVATQTLALLAAYQYGEEGEGFKMRIKYKYSGKCQGCPALIKCDTTEVEVQLYPHLLRFIHSVVKVDSSFPCAHPHPKHLEIVQFKVIIQSNSWVKMKS